MNVKTKSTCASAFAFCFILSPFFLRAAQISEHSTLIYNDYPSACLNCHEKNILKCSIPPIINGRGLLRIWRINDSPQGKLFNGFNSYCINIMGNWAVCGTCHAGRGPIPDTLVVSMENIDCLVCHNEEYAANRKRLATAAWVLKILPTEWSGGFQNPPGPTVCHAMLPQAVETG